MNDEYDRVNLDDEQMVRYWTGALGVPEERLREIVAEHGDDPDAVRDAVGRGTSREE